MTFKKGDRMYWKSTGKPAYEKLGDDDCDWWVSLDSTYVVKEKGKDGKDIDVIKPESDKPLYRENGDLNRFGFKWPDEQVYKWYRTIMNFEKKED